MTGFAVYSATAEPNLLYETGDTSDIGPETTAGMVWVGNRPLDLVADLENRRLWWAFQADRETKTTRTGYFIAAYDGDEDLFGGFAEALRELHESDEWELPHADDLRKNAGFELYRIPETVSGGEQAAFDRLVDRLAAAERTPHARAVTVGMERYRDALQTLRALEEAGVACTVGVDEGNDHFLFQQIDALLVPGAERNFDVRDGEETESGGRADAVEAESTAETASASAERSTERERSGRSRYSAGELTSRIAGAVLVGLLGFGTYSFFTSQPVQPISGLSTFGAFFGTIAAVGLWYGMSDSAGSQSATARRRAGLSDWLWGPFRAYGGRATIVLTLGTLAGFVFPTLFWELGLWLGRDGFLFGPMTALEGSVLAVAAYLGVLFAGAVTALALDSRTGSGGGISVNVLGRTVAGFAVYGLCLVLATGLANALWFEYIPAA